MSQSQAADQFAAVRNHLNATVPNSHVVNETTAMAILAAADRIAKAIEELTTAVKAINGSNLP